MKRISMVTVKLAGYGRSLVPIYGSSVLAAWAYDSTSEIFTVVFHSGIVKKYSVPIPTVQAFMGAKSKGGFYNRQIKKLRKLEASRWFARHPHLKKLSGLVVPCGQQALDRKSQ
jgi:KTSC domain-containing protein